MIQYTVNIPEIAEKAIQRISVKKGITPEQLVQSQIEYYLACVIGDEIRNISTLTVTERLEMESKVYDAQLSVVQEIISRKG